jgi:hypothetical protein
LIQFFLVFTLAVLDEWSKDLDHGAIQGVASESNHLIPDREPTVTPQLVTVLSTILAKRPLSIVDFMIVPTVERGFFAAGILLYRNCWRQAFDIIPLGFSFAPEIAGMQ